MTSGTKKLDGEREAHLENVATADAAQLGVRVEPAVVLSHRVADLGVVHRVEALVPRVHRSHVTLGAILDHTTVRVGHRDDVLGHPVGVRRVADDVALVLADEGFLVALDVHVVVAAQ